MKTVTIEQVANGYIVSKRSHRDDFDPCVSDKSGIHVFETFGSMVNWLSMHFEPAKPEDIAVTPLHLGDDEI